MKRITLVLAVAILFTMVAFAWAKKRDYSAWAMFSDGSSVTVEIRYESESITRTARAQKILVHSAEESVELEKKLFSGDLEVQRFSETLPLIPLYRGGKNTRHESLRIDGKAYDCEVWEYAIKTSTDSGDGTVWFAPKLMTVLQRKETRDSKSISSVAIAVHERVTVNDKDFYCLVLEGSVTGKGFESKSKTWVSRDMPGGLVKSETHATIDGKDVTQIAKVVAFEIK